MQPPSIRQLSFDYVVFNVLASFFITWTKVSMEHLPLSREFCWLSSQKKAVLF